MKPRKTKASEVFDNLQYIMDEFYKLDEENKKLKTENKVLQNKLNQYTGGEKMELTTDVFTVTNFNGGKNYQPKVYSSMEEAVANYKIQCALEITRAFKDDPEIHKLSLSLRNNNTTLGNVKEKVSDDIIEYTEGTYPDDISYSLHMCRIKDGALVQLFGIR